MKKSTIWYISIVLLLAFLGLLSMQYQYLEEIHSSRREQFSENVVRALFRTSRQLERQETQHYLQEYYDEGAQDLLERFNQDDDEFKRNYTDYDPFNLLQALGGMQMSESFSHSSISYTNPDGSVSTFEFSGIFPDSLSLSASMALNYKPQKSKKSKDDHSIQARQKTLQEMLIRRYLHQRDVLDEVIFRTLAANDRPLIDRIDPDQLKEILTHELDNVGCQMPFEFSLVDQNGRSTYSSPGFKKEESEAEGSYLQPIFDNNSADRTAYMEVYFPEANSLLLHSVLRYMIPSFLFSFLILCLFVFVIYVVFRQKKLSEMKNDFINNMTHEFKTPIASISLASQMLNDPGIAKAPGSVQRLTDVIADETKRLRFQVEKVLQMSMFERQKTNLKRVEIPVNALIDSVVNTFTLKVEKSGGTIETALDADEDICNLDEMHFTNVIFNLMENAHKYAREEEPLHLHVSTRNPDEHHLEIRVKDNGIGIQKEHLKRIFEKFYRVPTGNVHNVKGFGLGLSYVYKIVVDHGGSIKAESVFGKGSTFIITLPLLEE